jgi:hypothetical protein
MTSWEDVINQVVIPGDGQAIRNAKSEWELVLSQILRGKDTLDGGLRDLAAWKGDAGETYRTNIGKIAKMLGDIHEQSKGIIDPLGTAATQMDDSISKIQIPAECIHDVAQAKEVFVNTDALAGMPNGYIYSAMSAMARSDMIEGMLSLPGGGIVKGLRNWISSADDDAIAEYERLNNNYGNNAVMMPVGSDIPGGVNTDITGIPDLPHLPGGGGGGSLPGTGAGGLPTTSFDPSTSATGLDDLGTGTGIPTDTTGLDTGGLPGSGLAGAGGGGLTGAGLDGLGSGRGLSGAGLGAGGLGAGSGLGGAGLPRVGGLGPAVSPGMGMGGMMGGGAGAGGRGGGRGGASRSGMMGGAPMGGHGAGGEDEHGTWLQEDDDVWGTDSGAAPPLLT